MSYEMNINAGVTGVDQVERAAAASDKYANSTKRVDDAIKAYAASNDKLQAKLLEIEKNELRLEQLREQHRMQTERLAAATDKHTASQERLNGAMRSHVTDVQAASASIRAFEGHLPIRAVEQFTTKMLGLGPVFQMAFPIVGAIALAEAIERGGEKLVKLYDKYVLLKDVQAEVIKGARELADEYENAAIKLDRFLIQSLRDQGQYRAAAQIETRDIQSTPLRLPKVDQEKISGLSSYQQKLVMGAYSEIIPADIPRRISEIQNRLHTLNLDLEDYARGGPVRVNAPSQRQAELEKQFYENLLPVLGIEKQRADAESKAAGDRATKEEQKESERIARERERIEERILELRKKAEEAAMRSYFGNSLEGRAAYDQVRLGIEEADAIRKNPTRANEIRGYYTILRTSAYGEKTAAINARDLREAEQLDEVSRSSTNKLFGADRKEAALDMRELQDILRISAPPAPDGYVSAQQQLRDVRNSERRYLSLARVSGQLSGQSQRDQIDSEYGARVRFANEEYQAELRLADLKKTDAEKEAARADALDQKAQKLFDAQMEREKALLEITLRQKEEFQRNFVGFIHAAASGNAGGFIRRQAEAIGDRALGAIAGKIFEAIIKARAANQGVPWADMGIGAKQIDSTVDNTRATDDNTQALRDLTHILVMGGGMGSGGPIGTIGFPSGSNGPGVMGGSSSTIMYGFPGAGGGANLGRLGGIGMGVAGAGLLYGGLRTGGVRGGLQAGAGAAAIAGSIIPMLAPALAAAGPIGAAAAAVLEIGSLVAGMFGSNRESRSRDISNTLAFGRYIDPVAINASMTTFGGYADYDRFGGVRGSSLSPFPITQAGYRDPFNGNSIVPGRTVSPFGGGPAVTVNVQAMDAKSIVDRHQDIADAVVRAFDGGHTGLQEKVRSF